MTKRKKFKPARFMPGRGIPWHGGMKPLPRPAKPKKTALDATNTQSGKGGKQNLTGTDSTLSVPQMEGRAQV